VALAFRVSDLPRFAVMGVVNVTPDSFSDGGRFRDPAAAVAHGVALAEAGAAVLDVGGESTRPGALPVPEAEERARVLPVVAQLAARVDVPISVDTRKASVAAEALAAGAAIVNDVSAGTSDPAMLPTVADAGAGFVAMHMRGTPETMQDDPRYGDVVAEVAGYLAARVAAASTAGVRPDAVLVDPGIGFGKTIDHNLALLAALPELAARAGAPVCVGASRKAFLGRILGDLPPSEREEATLAATVWSFAHGARIVRVHDVEQSARAGALLDVLARATPEGIAA
jgi:dihydropteroate synthase